MHCRCYMWYIANIGGRGRKRTDMQNGLQQYSVRVSQYAGGYKQKRFIIRFKLKVITKKYKLIRLICYI